MTSHPARVGQPTTDFEQMWFYGCATACGVVAVVLLSGLILSFWSLDGQGRFIMAGVILVPAVLVLSVCVGMARREAALAKVAKEFGFTFQCAIPFGTIPFDTRKPHTELFRHRGKVDYLMQGKTGPWTVWVLDYDNRDNPEISGPTVTAVVLRRGWAGLPAFQLYPKGLGQKLAALFGAQHVDFEDSPEFTRTYTLRGPDEGAIRRVFRNEVRDLFALNPGWHVEAGGGDFVVYRWADRSVRPRELPALVAQAVELREEFGLPPETPQADELPEDRRDLAAAPVPPGKAVGVPSEEAADEEEPPKDFREAVQRRQAANADKQISGPAFLALLSSGLAMFCFPFGLLGLALGVGSYLRARRDLRDMDCSGLDPAGRPLALRTRRAAAMAVGLNAAFLLIWVVVLLQNGSVHIKWE